MIKISKKILPFVACFIFSSEGVSQDTSPQNLDQLLSKIKKDYKEDSLENVRREKEFLEDKNNQQILLSKARAELARQKRIEDGLKKTYDSNEMNLAKLEEKLKLTVGTLGELFGVVRQVAGDTKGQFENSIITSQYPDRSKFIEDLSTRKSLPNSEDLEKLWIELLTDMTESGKIVRFQSSVIDAEGNKNIKQVTRVGVFNLLAEDKYLRYDDTTKSIMELGRQPASHFLSLADDYTGASDKKIMPLGLDPSRGAILSALVQAPSLSERYHQGGLVGYVITFVLLTGLFITVRKLFFLINMEKSIAKQIASNSIDPKNPLGMIFDTFEKFKDKGLDNLELALEESIFKATKKIEKGLKTIKILAAVAPLLGLLGTVTGMIGTFQSMMLFGSGDPKVMAGGISQALVTTVLGLIAAIPLILLHSFVSGKSKEVTEVIEEQSIGLMAQRSK